ncbi:MAG TPA: SH3 domain-containing protein [Aggregatilineales bacterium]|nr:SH3 domain-containing protein [Aggregatilineales bacterium]
MRHSQFSLRKHAPGLLLAGSLLLTFAAALDGQPVEAQNPTATPVQIIIPTLTATPEPQVTTTPSRTPTQALPGLARVEAISKETGANLRAAPSTDAEKLGTIYPGQFYGVIGRYEKWLEIQYDKSPTGLAWVYQDIVNVTGLDPNAIPTVAPNIVPSPNVSTSVAQQTAAVITLTPGGPEAATAAQASATGVFTRLPGSNVTDEPTLSGPLPTFTFPAGYVEATLPVRTSLSTSQTGIPPIVPIIALGGVGLFGLFISALRRM